jgi:hypothetical protein
MATENKSKAAATDRLARSEAPLLTPSRSGRGLSEANPWLKVIFNENRKCRIRILIVVDGDLGFDVRDFGLSELIVEGILASATPCEELSVVTAHRRANESAQIPDFRFDTLPDPPYNFPCTTEHYEQVWLFGINKALGSDGKKHKDALTEAELAVLANFMNAGGGVFATGDHQDLGAALCGEVPRVRSMRKWFVSGVEPTQQAPDRNNETRLDTLREGRTPGFSSDDQSDQVPQEIRPKFKMAEGCKDSKPHYLLSHKSFAITVLPDHMHEGECVVPSNLCDAFSFGGAAASDEFPRLPGRTDRLAPEMVAIATSAGGYLQDEINILPVHPRCFNIIVAYDGHHVGVGRVAVDASFHHFININLKGKEDGSGRKKGFYDELGNPIKEYVAIKQYYRNLVIWLCPPEVRFDYYVKLLVSLRYLSPLIEEIQPQSQPSCDDILYAGVVTHNAIAERFSTAEATQCALVLAAALPEELRRMVVRFTDPWLPRALRGEKQLALLDAGVMLKMVLGSAMLGIAAQLPDTTSEVSETLAQKELQGERLADLVTANLAAGVNLLTPLVNELSDALRSLSTALDASR